MISSSSENNRTWPQFPLVGVGIVVRKNEQVLLIKRGQEPLKGIWTVPGGLVHVGENLEHAVRRELYEECGLRIQNLKQVDIFEYISHDQTRKVLYHYIIIEFASDYLSGSLQALSDVEESQWVHLSLIDQFITTGATKSLIMKAFGR